MCWQLVQSQSLTGCRNECGTINKDVFIERDYQLEKELGGRTRRLRFIFNSVGGYSPPFSEGQWLCLGAKGQHSLPPRCIQRDLIANQCPASSSSRYKFWFIKKDFHQTYLFCLSSLFSSPQIVQIHWFYFPDRRIKWFGYKSCPQLVQIPLITESAARIGLWQHHPVRFAKLNSSVATPDECPVARNHRTRNIILHWSGYWAAHSVLFVRGLQFPLGW